MIYTEPRILQSKTGKWSVYFSITFDSGEKKFFRFADGSAFGMEGRGNGKTVSLAYKHKYFGMLRNVISDKLASGWYPGYEKDNRDKQAFSITLKYLRENIAKLYANKGYRRNMLFLLSKMEKQKGWKSKPTSEVLTKENLLNLLYGHAQGTYFNTQRAHLVALMGKLIDIGILKQNPMTGVSKVSAKPSKNVAFDKQQLKNLFEAMSDQYPNLYLGCLLMYTTLLRPNKEIRSLKRKFFSDDLSMLVIPDHYTKNKNGRNVPLSQHTIEELQKFGIHKLEPEDNIFGHQYNDEYFTQVWGKFRRKNPNLIKPGQTLYSIRHTAALEIYRKTNSVQKVKIAMDHSDIVMTIKYLRSLDIFETLIDVNDLPEIDF